MAEGTLIKSGSSAASTSFDNTGTNLAATNTQDAIVELNNNLFGSGNEEDMSLAEQVSEMYDVMVNGKPSIYAVVAHGYGVYEGTHQDDCCFSSDESFFTASAHSITIKKSGSYTLDMLSMSVRSGNLQKVTLKRDGSTTTLFTVESVANKMELLEGDVLTVTATTSYACAGIGILIVRK